MSLCPRRQSREASSLFSRSLWKYATTAKPRRWRPSKGPAEMTANLRLRIAIPMPHSGNAEYSERAIPQYERAVKLAGGEPVRIRLDQTPAEVLKIAASCHGVLLPGSNADVDPARFGAI